MTRLDLPPPMVPTPAWLFPELRGQRVIVGVPGIGFRTDLRADDPVVNGGRTFVPVLTEQDYYRAEIEQIEVFAPLVPIDRVWVEYVTNEVQRTTQRTGALDGPMSRRPLPVTAGTPALGMRVVQGVPDGFVRDLRAVTDTYSTGDGSSVRVCGEADWYRWALTGATPSTTIEISSMLLWIE
jgi:hypothetical protein